MAFWQSLELSFKTLSQFVDNLDPLQKTLENKETCTLFFNRFPFEKLLNITILDGPNIMLCVKLLHLFTNYEEFYTCDERFNYTLEFILINLMNMMHDCEEILVLLELLCKILYQNVKTIDDSFKNLFDRERILEVLLKLSKFESIHKTKFKFYAPILNRLLETGFPDSIDGPIARIFEEFDKHNAVAEQAVTCRNILNRKRKLFNHLFEHMWKWLTELCPLILASEHLDNDLLENMTYCLVTFKTTSELAIGSAASLKLTELVGNLDQKLLKISSNICLYTSNVRVRGNCLILLKFMLMKFITEELSCSVEGDVFNEIDNFPEEVENWPKSNQDVFFCICHMCICSDKIIWNKRDILNAMMQSFYNRRHLIKPFVLKSILFLYPLLKIAFDSDFYVTVLGDDLLNFFSKLCSVSHLYSYNRDQLKWMLEVAPKSVKLTVLSEWLVAAEKDKNCEEILVSTIQDCGAEETLLQIILDSNFSKRFGSKCALLLHKMSNERVLNLITLILPLTVEKPISFYNLILAHPDHFSSDLTHSILICSLMSAIIPTMTDNEVLKGACVFTGKVLKNNKNNPDVLHAFCQYVANISDLIEISKKVDDETATEILNLLNLLVRIQIRNQIRFDYKLEEDFRVFMKGSTRRIHAGLKFLQNSMIFKYSSISLNSRSAMGVYQNVWDYSLKFDLQEDAYKCISIIITKIPWLARTDISVIHLEMACLSYSDVSNENLLNLIEIWLKSIGKVPYNGFCLIPETAIMSFVSRVCNHEQRKKNILDTLEYVMEKQSSLHKSSVF